MNQLESALQKLKTERVSAERFDSQVRAFRRHYNRGAMTWNEYSAAVVKTIFDTDVTNLAVALPEWLHDQRTAQSDGVPLITIDEAVRFAYFGYSRISQRNRADGQASCSRHEVWALIDEHLPWIRSEALDHARSAVEERTALVGEGALPPRVGHA